MYRNTGNISSDEEVLELVHKRVPEKYQFENPSTSEVAMQAEQIANASVIHNRRTAEAGRIIRGKISLNYGGVRLVKKSKNTKIQTFKEIEFKPEIECNEPLYMVKSVPEFNGKQEYYVSWRQAATAAYKIFQSYEGSNRHYKAVGILKNKIRGSAAAVLVSFNTVFNFHAILARLDFTYADKTPTHVIKQELSLSRQGDLPLLKHYDEIERKLKQS